MSDVSVLMGYDEAIGRADARDGNEDRRAMGLFARAVARAENLGLDMTLGCRGRGMEVI